MRRVPIRLKLLVALAVPLLALGVVTVFEVLQASRQADDVRAQTELARATIGAQPLITALQRERQWAALDLVGRAEGLGLPASGYGGTRAATDDARRAFEASLARGPIAVAAAYLPAVARLDALARLRVDVDAAARPGGDDGLRTSMAVSGRYGMLISSLLDVGSRIALAVDDSELRRGAELADTAARQGEVLAGMLDDVLVLGLGSSRGIDRPGEMATVALDQDAFRANTAVLTRAGGRYRAVARREFPFELTDTVNAVVDGALTRHTVAPGRVVAVMRTGPAAGYGAYQDALASAVAARAGELNGAAAGRTRGFLALAALVLGAAAALTWLVSRSITRPLRSLTQQAKDMAEHRLPDAVIDILETPLGDDVAVPH
ncbi:MAG TPA: nitrate- and nitrite sensing domain-containing protein, partial [Acidimicrobiales bacterium]|nr:nitrate- and nitrite sensing domain-containing protein [Acidimicrobiales bacterium]